MLKGAQGLQTTRACKVTRPFSHVASLVRAHIRSPLRELGRRGTTDSGRLWAACGDTHSMHGALIFDSLFGRGPAPRSGPASRGARIGKLTKKRCESCGGYSVCFGTRRAMGPFRDVLDRGLRGTPASLRWVGGACPKMRPEPEHPFGGHRARHLRDARELCRRALGPGGASLPIRDDQGGFAG